MLRFSKSFCAAVLLATVLAGCGDEDEPGALPIGIGDTPVVQGRLDLWGKWDGTRLAHPFLMEFSNTDVLWDFSSAVSLTDMLGDVVYYDNSADFGVILWTEPSPVAGKYQKFSWEMVAKYEALLLLYEEKDTLAEAMDDTVVTYGPSLLTYNMFSGCHCHAEDGYPP